MNIGSVDHFAGKLPTPAGFQGSPPLKERTVLLYFI